MTQFHLCLCVCVCVVLIKSHQIPWDCYSDRLDFPTVCALFVDLSWCIVCWRSWMERAKLLKSEKDRTNEDDQQAAKRYGRVAGSVNGDIVTVIIMSFGRCFVVTHSVWSWYRALKYAHALSNPNLQSWNWHREPRSARSQFIRSCLTFAIDARRFQITR